MEPSTATLSISLQVTGGSGSVPQAREQINCCLQGFAPAKKLLTTHHAPRPQGAASAWKHFQTVIVCSHFPASPRKTNLLLTQEGSGER